MPKGKPLSDETKKKISEALKKNGGGVSAKPAPVIGGKEGVLLISKYNTAANEITGLIGQLKGLKGKENKEKRKEIHAQIKIHRAAIERVKARAKELKAVDHAQKTLAQSDLKMKKTESMKKKISAKIKDFESNISGDKKGDRQKKMIENMKTYLERLDKVTTNAKDSRSKAEAIIKSKGKDTSSANGNELGLSEICLSSKKYAPFRALTLVEEKCNFEFLAETFDELEKQMEDDLVNAVDEDLKRSVKMAKTRIENKDIAGLAALVFIFPSKIRKIIMDYVKESFERGKKTASEELKVERPITPLVNSQLMNFQASQIADEFSNEINKIAKETAREGLTKDVATAAIIAAILNKTGDKSGQMISNLEGSVIGENLNKGRRLVFEKNIFAIKGYQRSEIMDDKTCNTCMSMDQRIVKTDDPMAKMDLVHTNCRGIWIPILNDEETTGSFGIPSSITNSFNKVGGVPFINSFDQLKKPINKANAGVQAELQKRLSKGI